MQELSISGSAAITQASVPTQERTILRELRTLNPKPYWFGGGSMALLKDGRVNSSITYAVVLTGGCAILDFGLLQ